MIRTVIRTLLLVLVGLVLLAGCERDLSEKVAKVAQQAADRQAQQNTEMAQLNREVAEGTKRLVEADAVARKEIITVHQELQAERGTLNDGFADLETERKEIAKDRRTESLLVPAAKILGGALVTLAVVIFCLSLVFGLGSDKTTEADLNELLICDLVRDRPRIINLQNSRPALEDHAEEPQADPPRLPSSP